MVSGEVALRLWRPMAGLEIWECPSLPPSGKGGATAPVPYGLMILEPVLVLAGLWGQE